MKTLRNTAILLMLLIVTSCTPEFLAELEAQLAKIHYVSADGDNSNSGKSPEEAWRTLEPLQYTDLPTDAIIYLRSGDTFDGSILIDQPMSITTYGEGKATITSGIRVLNTGKVHLSNLIVKGNGENTGILLENNKSGNTQFSDIEILNVEVHGFKNHGILIMGTNDNSGFNNVLIEGAKIYDILYAGIASEGFYGYQKVGYSHSNINVRNCEVFNIWGDKNKTNGHSGNGIVLADVQHSVIEYSKVYDCAQYNNNPGGGAVGIWYWDSDSVIIQHNEVYGMSSGLTNKDGAGFDLDGGVTNGIMQYNYSHDNDGGGYIVGQFEWARPMKNIIVRYNLSINDARRYSSGIYLFSGDRNMQDIYIYNNTVIKPQGKAYSMTKWGSGAINNVHVYNNILYGSFPTTGITQSNNYTANPDLDGFKLKAGSPLINAGKDLEYEIGGQDFFGNNPRNGVQDIGAHEFN